MCLGHQGLALHYGARISRAPEPIHGRSALVHHDGSRLFDGIPSPFEVIRYHSLCALNLPDSLQKTAWTDDGIVMGVQHRERPQWGVQFHPESIGSIYGDRLIKNFLSQLPDRKKTWLVGPVDQAPTEKTQTIYRVSFTTVEWVEPESVFVGLSERPGSRFWLDTTRVHPSDARFSYIGDDTGPLAYSVRYDVQSKRVTCLSGVVEHPERRQF